MSHFSPNLRTCTAESIYSTKRSSEQKKDSQGNETKENGTVVSVKLQNLAIDAFIAMRNEVRKGVNYASKRRLIINRE